MSLAGLDGPRPHNLCNGDLEARLRLLSNAEIIRMYGGSRSDVQSMDEEAAKRRMQHLIKRDYLWIIEALLDYNLRAIRSF